MKMHICLAFCAVAALTGCSRRTEATDKLDQAQSRVGIGTTAYPNAVIANTDFIISASVSNAGQVTLPALGKDKGDLYRVGVSYHWRQMDEKIAVWDGVFNPLKLDLKKGATLNMDIAVKAPPGPGRYILELDVLQNGAFWFGGAGSQTARITVDVK
jgi:hypothetical protein